MSVPDDAQHLAAVIYAWASDEPGIPAEGQTERARAHCRQQGWTIAAAVEARRFPELTRLTQAIAAHRARYVVVPRETVDTLERHFREAWQGTRARIEARGALLVVI